MNTTKLDEADADEIKTVVQSIIDAADNDAALKVQQTSMIE